MRERERERGVGWGVAGVDENDLFSTKARLFFVFSDISDFSLMYFFFELRQIDLIAFLD